MLRNVAGQALVVQVFDDDGFVDVDPATLTLQMKVDGASPVNVAGPPTGLGRGKFFWTLTAGQTDGYALIPLPSCSVAGVEVMADELVIYTRSASEAGASSPPTSGQQTAAGGVVVDAPLAKDFDLMVITPTTNATSNLVVTIKRCSATPVPTVLLDSATGLRQVLGVASPVAAMGSVVRDSSTRATIHIDADAIDHLSPGLYDLDLTELTSDGKTYLRHEAQIAFRRVAGREMAS